MANSTLIKGAAEAANKFVDIGGSFSKGFYNGIKNSSRPKTVEENDKYQDVVNSYMSKMKTGMDFTSFSNQETSAIRNFLLAEREKYADAAKNIAKIEDRTSQEYMQYVDIMNGVNSSFTNLASQLGAYKKSKLEYAQDQLNNSLSKGTDPEHNRQAMIMYGFYDANGDKKSDDNYDAPFQILEGGNVGFNIDNKVIPFNDAPAPVYKDYKLANNILKANEAAYKQGKPMTKIEADMYKMQLEEALQDPNALKSIVYDFESELNMNDIGSIWDNNKTSPDIVNKIRNLAIDRLVKARSDVSNEGIAEKKRMEQESINKALRRKNALKSQGGSGGGRGRGSSNLSFSSPYKGSDGKYYVHQLDANGNEIGNPIYDEATTKANSPTSTSSGSSKKTDSKKTPPKKEDKGIIQGIKEWAFGTGKK